MATHAPARGQDRPGDVPWVVPVAIALPLVGLAMFLARPELDMEWEHHPSHFWLVLLTAAVSVALAYVTNVAAGRYRISFDTGAYFRQSGVEGASAWNSSISSTPVR